FIAKCKIRRSEHCAMQDSSNSSERPIEVISRRMQRLDRSHRALSGALGGLALASAGLLLVWNLVPRVFPAGAHDMLGAVPLVSIAVAYLSYEAMRGGRAKERLKAVLLALAFFFWAANQLWPNAPRARLFNDVAVALFVLDMFLVIHGWPKRFPDKE